MAIIKRAVQLQSLVVRLFSYVSFRHRLIEFEKL